MKKIIIWLIILAAAGLVIWLLSPAGSLERFSAPAEDTAAAISKDLEGINLDGIDSDFQDVDADLNTL